VLKQIFRANFLFSQNENGSKFRRRIKRPGLLVLSRSRSRPWVISETRWTPARVPIEGCEAPPPKPWRSLRRGAGLVEPAVDALGVGRDPFACMASEVFRLVLAGVHSGVLRKDIGDRNARFL